MSLLICIHFQTWAASPLERDERAISELRSGKRQTANASWWGFNGEDTTESLQAAIDSEARRVVVPALGEPWIVRPIRLRSELELEFEPGVVVVAKKGEFHDGGDSLFSAMDVTNLTIRGTGAVWRMRKKDYQNPPYAKAEWRMGLRLAGCKDVLVEGVRIESTGGDGIYVSSSKSHRWSENVAIRNCVCDDNHRQGISVISAVNLLIENCTLSGTEGTIPEAGIDFEPDEPDERLGQCLVRNCRFLNNRGSGMLVYLKPLTEASQPISIRFENCHVEFDASATKTGAAPQTDARGGSGIAVGEAPDNNPGGLVEFVHCSSASTGREAVRIFNKSASGPKIWFEDCHWTNSWVSRYRTYGGPRVPILLRREESASCQNVGGVEFVNCHVTDVIEGPTVRFEDDRGISDLRDVTGSIAVQNPTGVLLRLGPRTEGVTLQLRDISTNR